MGTDARPLDAIRRGKYNICATGYMGVISFCGVSSRNTARAVCSVLVTTPMYVSASHLSRSRVVHGSYNTTPIFSPNDTTSKMAKTCTRVNPVPKWADRCATLARVRLRLSYVSCFDFDSILLFPLKAPPPPPAHAERENQNDRLAWRQLAPFFLIIGVFLLLVYKYVTSASSRLPPPAAPAPPVVCPDGLDRYVVRQGDTCWEIARAHQWTVGELVAANKEVDCDHLQIGRELCVLPHSHLD